MDERSKRAQLLIKYNVLFICCMGIFAPVHEAVDAVDAPEDVLGGHAVVAGTEPEEDIQHVDEEPQVPLFAVSKDHQHLGCDGRHGGESV